MNNLPTILVGALSLAFLGTLCAADASQSTGKPNIVVILADDFGYADPGFNGGTVIKTPTLDRLAQEGAVLRSHFVQPVCSPTRAALMTGRYAVHTGVYTIVRPGAEWGLPLAERTLANALHDAGYETAICGKWHLGEFEKGYQPTRRGFDHQYGHWFGAIDYFTHKRDGVLDWHRNDQPLQEEGYSTHLIAQEACRRIREKQPDKPLFLYLPFNAVHAPHQVPKQYTDAYPALKGTRHTYAGMVAAMDEAIGRVVATLEEKGLRDNTLIIFSSDNGGPSPGKVTDNGPLRAGKGTLYEGGVRACAFASWPAHIPANQIIEEPVHMVDWYPTLIKLAGGTLAQKLPVDGRDLWSVLTSKAKSPHDAVLLCGTHGALPAGIRMGNWKLLVGASDTDAEDDTNDKRASRHKLELYNLAEDLSEKNNLAEKYPDKFKELHDRLLLLTRDAVAPGNSKGDAKPLKKRAKN